MTDLAPTKLTEREHLEAAREATEARKEALQEELARTERWLEWFDQGIAIAEGAEPPALPPAGPEPERAPATQKKAAPATRHTGTRRRQADSSEAQERAERVLEVIRNADGPVARREILAELDLTDSEFKVAMRTLRQKKKVTQVGARAGARYVLANSPITPSTGPKTSVEREMYGALAERPLTAAGVAVKCKRSTTECSTVLEGMARRGTVLRMDVDDPPVRYVQSGEYD